MVRGRLLGAPLGDQRLWPVVLVLLAAVLVPTMGVLWFMNEAMRNERLAVREKLAAAYRGPLAALTRRVDAYWEETHAALAAVEADHGASEIFADLVRAGVADSVVVYDTSGRVRYPSRAPLHASEPTPESAEWRGARGLEFERAEYVQAAQAYAAIASRTSSLDLAARALQAQARCLVKAGRRDAALEILTGTLDAPQYRDATDDQGSLIVPSTQLLALQLVADPSRAEYRETSERLAERLRDYSESALSATQRRFLMEELQAITLRGCGVPDPAGGAAGGRLSRI